jgi:MinD-like ATPase involved in chromosome partitioning or flagellar assembly
MRRVQEPRIPHRPEFGRSPGIQVRSCKRWPSETFHGNATNWLRLDFAAIRNASRAVQFLNRIGVECSAVQLIATRYGENQIITPAQAEAVLGMRIRHFVPDDPQSVNACIDLGAPVITEAPRSAFAKAIASIAESIAGPPSRLGAEPERAAERTLLPTTVGSIRSFLKLSLRDFALRPQ